MQYLDKIKQAKIISERDAFEVFSHANTISPEMRPRAARFLADYKIQQDSLGLPLWTAIEQSKNSIVKIKEQDALRVANSLGQLDETARKEAGALLNAYLDQQEKLGAPLWPSQEDAKRRQYERAREVIFDPIKLDAENGAYVQADRVAPGTGDKMRQRDAAIAWTATKYQVPEQEVREKWPAYKADLGSKWGTGVLDDSAFFNRAKQEQQEEEAKYLRLIFENPVELDRENAIFTRIDECMPGAADELRKREASALFLSYLHKLPGSVARKEYDTLKAQTLALWKEGQLDDLAFFERIKAEIMK